MDINIDNITNNTSNPIIQDIKKFLKTGVMPDRLKKKIDELPPYEIRLQQEIDKLNHKWAKDLIELLTKMDHKRNWLIKKEKEEFPQEEINKFEDKFEKIMIVAHKENEEEQKKYYVDKEATLILRILDYKNEYLLWIYDFSIPFTNNLSERGIRGAKSKMKASGQFWNIESAGWYATIRTYIETCNRNNVNVYNALLKLSLGKPYTLKQILEHDVD